MELYPGTKVTIGPPIENGFYYDFEFPPEVKVREEDLERIEAAMRAHIEADERVRAPRRARSPRRSRSSAPRVRTTRSS